MNVRRTLANRRAMTNLNYEHAGMKYILSFGRFDDGTISEMFLNTSMRSGNTADVVVQDAAVLVSLALQYGCPIATMKEAIKRDPNGDPQSPIGRAIDLIFKEEP